MFFVNNPTGILKADGTLYTPLDPVSSIAFRNEVDTSRPPLLGQVSSPVLEQPYTRQTNLGWAHQLNSSTAITVDYVRVDGRDINIRFRPNTQIDLRRAPPGRSAADAEHAVVPHGGQQRRKHV